VNWYDCEPFVNALAVQGLLDDEVPEQLVEKCWRIWISGMAFALQEVEEKGSVEVPPEPALDVPPDVVEKARRLQALAMDEAAAPQERENAWSAFAKIWKEYRLPPEFGL